MTVRGDPFDPQFCQCPSELRSGRLIFQLLLPLRWTWIAGEPAHRLLSRLRRCKTAMSRTLDLYNDSKAQSPIRNSGTVAILLPPPETRAEESSGSEWEPQKKRKAKVREWHSPHPNHRTVPDVSAKRPTEKHA